MVKIVSMGTLNIAEPKIVRTSGNKAVKKAFRRLALLDISVNSYVPKII